MCGMLFFHMRKLIGISVGLTVISGCVALPAWLLPGPFGRNLLFNFAILVAIGALCGTLALIDQRRRRRCRAPFLSRSPMSDEAFLTEIDCLPEHQHIALTVRGVFAELGGIPSVTIYPSDTLASLMELQFDLADFLGVIFRLEERLKVRVPRALPGRAYAELVNR